MLFLKKLKDEGFDFDKLPDDFKPAVEMVLLTNKDEEQKIQMLDNVLYKAIRQMFNEEVQKKAVDAEFMKMPQNDGFNTRINESSYLSYARGGKVTQREYLEMVKQISNFVPYYQISTLDKIYRGEEKESAVEIISRLSEIIKLMPGTYETEKIPAKEKIVYLHYFSPSMNWYIVEKDKGDKDDDIPGKQLQAYGYVTDNDFAQGEWGYIDIESLSKDLKFLFEIDMYFTPVKFSELVDKKEKAEDIKSSKFKKVYFGDKMTNPLLNAGLEQVFNDFSTVKIFHKGLTFFLQDNTALVKKMAELSYSCFFAENNGALTEIFKIKEGEYGSLSEFADMVKNKIEEFILKRKEPLKVPAKESANKIKPVAISLNNSVDYNSYKDANEALIWFIKQRVWSNIAYKITFADGFELDGIIDIEPFDDWKVKKTPFTWHLNNFWPNLAYWKEPLVGIYSQEDTQFAIDLIQNYDLGESEDFIYTGNRRKNVSVNNKKEKNKVLSKEYPNAYALNKAIEELLDSRDNNSFSEEEKSFLRYYSGYGGLEKYGATGKGLLYEYYTPSLVAQKMWGLAYKYGFNGGKVLEPAAGIGEFIKYAPEQSKVTAFEINKYSARICKILYPEASVHSKYFEELFIKNNDSIKGKTGFLDKYDLIIGNPPYGEFGGKYAGMGEKSYTRAGNYIDYFIFRGLDLLNTNGLLIYIIGAEVAAGGKCFLSQQTNKCKEEIMAKSALIDAYRLPNGIFERTDVLSDIIVLQKR